jgi:hypothetical protein
MDTSQVEQIKCAAPVWVWDGYWWPAVVADVDGSGGFLIALRERSYSAGAEGEVTASRPDEPGPSVYAANDGAD